MSVATEWPYPQLAHTEIGPGVALTVQPDAPHGVLVWHDCPTDGRWRANLQGTHLSSGDPTTITFHGSVLYECCGLHGFIRGGVWTAA